MSKALWKAIKKCFTKATIAHALQAHKEWMALTWDSKDTVSSFFDRADTLVDAEATGDDISTKKQLTHILSKIPDIYSAFRPIFLSRTTATQETIDELCEQLEAEEVTMHQHSNKDGDSGGGG